MSTNEKDPRLILLAEGDNVLMIATTLKKGDAVRIEDKEVEILQDLSLGHKLAARTIEAGEVVTKYNFPIGVATEKIPFGAHVHVHNVRSDYTPSYVVPEPVT